MFLRRLLIVLCLLSPLAANAQSSKTDVVSAINVDFADNTAGAITAALLRTVTTQMVSSYVDWLTCTGQGGIAYWNASAAPTCLVSGTAGQVLSTYNTPAWESLASKLTAGTGVTITGTITPTIATSPSAVLDFLGSTQNSILYRAASGWTILPPGTNGQYLRTDNPPFWSSIASAITAGTGIIITGTITPTIAVSPNAVLDTYGTTQGGVLYRGSTGWAFLSPGTSGQVFTTGGTGANPSYTTVAGTGTVQSITCGLGLTCSSNPITVTGTISQTVSISSATNGAMYGVSSSAISATTAGTNGQVLMGNTGSAPTMSDEMSFIRLANNGMPAGSTGYFFYQGGFGAAETISAGNIFGPIPYNAIVKNLYVYSDTAPGSGKGLVFTFRTGSTAASLADTILTTTITGTTQISAADLTHSVVLPAGNLFSLKATSDAGTPTMGIIVTFGFMKTN